MKITLNRMNGVPLYIQLESHLEYLICTGGYEEGDLLPSIRTLARNLRLSLGTVRRAYRELEARRLVESQQGRGVVVKWNKPGGGRAALDLELRRVLEDPVRRALAMGFSGEQVVRGVLEFLSAHSGRVEAVFVGFNSYIAERYAGLLERELGDIHLDVKPLALDTLRARAVAADGGVLTANFVITQLYHLAEVEQLLSGLDKTIIPIMVSLSRESHARLAALPAGSRIGIVCHEIMAPASFDAVAAYHPDRKRWIHAVPADKRRLAAIQRVCTVAVTNGLDEDTARRLLGDALPIVPLIYIPTPESMTRLRMVLSGGGDLAVSPSVALAGHEPE